MSAKIELPGLVGSNPLGALAAFGLLSVIQEWDADAKLGFEAQDDWVAFLDSSMLTTTEQLISKLSHWIQSSELDKRFSWADDVRVPPAEFRSALNQALSNQDSSMALWLSALAADGAIDQQKGLIKPTAFYMVSGQQSFLGGVRELLTQIRAKPDVLFKEALVGPWQYQTPLHSLGLDPSTERVHALRNRAPTAEKPSCVAGAILLALAALPLMPTFSKQGRAITSGFSRREGENYFSWPIFTTPISISQLRSLLQCAAWKNSCGGLREGVAAVYRSRRSEFGQGYAVFRAAQPLQISLTQRIS